MENYPLIHLSFSYKYELTESEKYIQLLLMVPGLPALAPSIYFNQFHCLLISSGYGNDADPRVCHGIMIPSIYLLMRLFLFNAARGKIGKKG